MNLTKLYKRFSREQKELILNAWDNRFGTALSPVLFPFADLNTVILTLEFLCGDIPHDDSWNATVRRLIDQLVDFHKTNDATTFNLPKYRKLEKHKKRRK